MRISTLIAGFCLICSPAGAQQHFEYVPIEPNAVQLRTPFPNETVEHKEHFDRLVHDALEADWKRLHHFIAARVRPESETAANCEAMKQELSPAFRHIEGGALAPMRTREQLVQACLDRTAFQFTYFNMVCVMPQIIGPNTVHLIVRYRTDEKTPGLVNAGNVIRVAVRDLIRNNRTGRIEITDHAAFDIKEEGLRQPCEPLPPHPAMEDAYNAG